MVGTAAKVQQASADITRLDDVLQYRRDWRFSEASAPVETFAAGRLSLQGVTFGYNPLEPPLLDDVSPRGRARPVGGAGRRLGQRQVDLGKLITGLYAPRSGDVRIDGHTLAEWGRDRLAHIVSSVDQDICLFHGTLRDNITLWDETITASHACWPRSHDAGLGDVVKHLSGGYRRRHRGRRAQSERRPAPAHRDRPRAGAGAGAAGARRGDQRASTPRARTRSERACAGAA